MMHGRNASVLFLHRQNELVMLRGNGGENSGWIYRTDAKLLRLAEAAGKILGQFVVDVLEDHQDRGVNYGE